MATFQLQIENWDYFQKEKAEVLLESGPYSLQLATSWKQKLSLFKLRHDCFFRETGLTTLPGLDFDRYDFRAHHLMIVDERTQKVVGTYRAIFGEHAQDFYSAHEYRLDELLSKKGRKMELGRACVAKNYRNGIVLSLLWRGIFTLARRSHVRYLFGCASFPGLDTAPVAQLFQHNQAFHGKWYELSKRVKPKFAAPAKQLMKAMMEPQPVNEKFISEKAPLLNSYLQAGATIWAGPAFDKKMDCVDFLTVMDLQQMNSKHLRRYNNEATAATGSE